MNSFVCFPFSSAPRLYPIMNKSERKFVHELNWKIQFEHLYFFCAMVSTHSIFLALRKNIQHNSVKRFSPGRFYEGRIDSKHVSINIFYSFWRVFFSACEANQESSRRRAVFYGFAGCFSLLSLACQTLGPPHSWLSPQLSAALWEVITPNNVKRGFSVSSPSPLRAPATFSPPIPLTGNVQFSPHLSSPLLYPSFI